MPDMIRIANAGGYWGDDLSQFKRQVELAAVDYVTLDFLAEITMSIMQKQRARDSKTGYARDFIAQVEEALPLLVEHGTKVITNAGGVNPLACRGTLLERIQQHGHQLEVAAVVGDDLMDRLGELNATGVALDHMDDGTSFQQVRDRVSSANAYFGAWPVVEALKSGAQIVVTGRCTDTGITLAPMIHAFGWAADDWDRLAAGIVAGHIIECGAQSTGGNFTDWRRIRHFESIGYPVIEVFPDGSFVVTKHAGTGGAVTVRTVTEQLVYEMGDPRSYITPDVTADFGSIRLEQAGRDRVRVWGVRGRPAPGSLKVSASYFDGWKASGSLIISAPEAVAKARAFADLFWRRLGVEFIETHAELVGHSACWGPLAPERDPSEVLLRLSVRDRDRDKIEQFAKMIPAVILSGPPGVAVTGGRPQAQDVVAYWPALVPRDRVKPRLVTREGEQTLEWPTPLLAQSPVPPLPRFSAPPVRGSAKVVTVPLSRLAHARSGDKGDMCNIGVIARSPEIYPWLRRTLTAAVVKRHFKGICHGRVERHEVPNLTALNFLLHESLGGGGTVSLRLDAQGKTLSHALLAMEVRAPKALVDAAERADQADGQPPRRTPVARPRPRRRT
ncbi:MAG TPA: acyclic terpene utilization AtuA family protein [Candidatus Eisenbacteria bacterium]|nr:acyclic terpene utilization AtuA family protein [Candidatus Eisenbacteria bacterium]